MGRFWSWVRRRGAIAAFAAGALLTVLAVAVVAYLVLADQRRSARVLSAALTAALKREVEIERVTDLGPSRVVLHGLRLSTKAGWPADVKAESVEASGPLVSAARGEGAPVRVVVTRPTVVAGAGGRRPGSRRAAPDPGELPGERRAPGRRGGRRRDPGAGVGGRRRDVRRESPQGQRRGAGRAASARPAALTSQRGAQRSGRGRHPPPGPHRRTAGSSPCPPGCRRRSRRRPEARRSTSAPSSLCHRAIAPRGAPARVSATSSRSKGRCRSRTGRFALPTSGPAPTWRSRGPRPVSRAP